MYKAGQLTVIVGGMFSGKSTELQRQGRRHELAGKSVGYFKPSKDNRYKQRAIATHDGKQVEAHSVPHLDGIWLHGLDVACIDEIQFFDDKGTLDEIDHLLRQGTDVIVSGLDMDRFGETFGFVPQLMCKAETVVKVKAVCHGCGNDAWISSGTFTADEQTVVGEKEKYIPLCRTCYYEKGGLL